MPGKWVCTAEPKEDNYFIVQFPSQKVLTRTVAFGSAEIKPLGIKMIFEQWNESSSGNLLPLDWLRAFNLPKKLESKSQFCGL